MLLDISLNQFVVMIVPLVFAVTVHEVAHGWVAYRMGDPTAYMAGRLTLNPLKHLDVFGSLILPAVLKLAGSPMLFGYAKPVPVDFSRLRSSPLANFAVSAAGVAVNLALAVVSGIGFRFLLGHFSLWHHLLVTPFVSDLFLMLGYSALINAVLAVFNLLPVPPLDGSRMIAAFLPPALQHRMDRFERIGLVVVLLLLVTGSLDRLLGAVLNPLVQAILGPGGTALMFANR